MPLPLPLPPDLSTPPVSSDDTLPSHIVTYDWIHVSGSVAELVPTEIAGAPTANHLTPGHGYATSTTDLTESCGSEAPKIPTASVSSAELTVSPRHEV